MLACLHLLLWIVTLSVTHGELINVEQIQSDECRRHVELFLQGVDNLESWAMQMLDASAKLPSGVLRGNIRALGDFDECVELQGLSPISPQFCLTDIHVHDAAYPRLHELVERATLGRRDREILHNRTGLMVPNRLPMYSHIQAGVCVPASCGPRDIEMMMTSMLAQAVPKGVSITVELDQGACSGPQSNYPIPWFTKVFFTLLILLSVAGTAFDLQLPSESQDLRWIRAFSVKSNWSTLSDRGFISCLEGLRALSVFTVIMDHEIFQMCTLPLSNKLKFVKSMQNPEQLLFSIFISADNFFVISGLLRGVQVLKELDRKGSYSYQVFFSHAIRRYLRITPVMMVTILIYATILPSLGSGPLWYEYAVLPSQACGRNWFLNMFYLNNYFESQVTCADQTWYLSADWNMFLLAPVLVWSIWRWRHLAFHILTAVTFVSTAELFVYSYTTKALPTLIISESDEEILHYAHQIYKTVHHRIAAYIIGIGLGFVIHYSKKFKIQKVLQSHVIAGWSAALTLMVVVVFAGYPLKQYDYYDRGFAVALYGALHRPLWALAIAWIVFACHHGFGGWINSFLSAQFWLPLSRISLCISLLNPLVLSLNIGRLRSAQLYDNYELLRMYFGDCCVVIFFSFLLYFLVEAPSSRLMNIAFPPKKCVAKSDVYTNEEKNKVD